MNIKKLNKTYLEIACYIAFALCVAIAFYGLFFHYPVVATVARKLFRMMKPIIYGFALAYLISPVIDWIEVSFVHTAFPKVTDAGRRRALAVVFSYAVLVTGIVIFFSLVLPQLAASVWGLLERGPEYFKSTVDFAVRLYDRIPFLDSTLTDADILTLTDTALTRLGDWIADRLPQVLGISFSMASSVFNVIVSTVLSIYIVDSKEHLKGQFKKMLYAYLPQKRVNRLIDIAQDADRIFGGFITGKIIDSIIIGLICYFGMSIMGMPETTLISCIVGVTNVIPYFGPFIGGIPTVILMLFLDPSRAILYAVFVILLQQFDGNILGPKILGDSIGISALWVVVSVTFFGALFGVFGMLFGVPLFALLHKLLNDSIRLRLEKKKLPVETTTYEENHFKLEESKE
ncbi:MAG TPA: AI-2E family transporter [Candidatus Acidoferrum sp.]|nr:AI-2E family transporter [Candidatus Acidoferrum sp.]